MLTSKAAPALVVLSYSCMVHFIVQLFNYNCMMMLEACPVGPLGSLDNNPSSSLTQ